jgi:plastocyanin
MAFRKILIVAVLAAAGSACSSSSTPSSSSTTMSPGTTSTGTSLTVSIPSGARSLTTTAFGTNPLVVAAGSTVTWTNNDSIAHDSVADGGMWNSGILSPGQSFPFKFTTAGTFTYKCTIHPNMVGTVTVQ